MAELNADPQDDKKIPVVSTDDKVQEVEVDTQPIIAEVTEKVTKANKLNQTMPSQNITSSSRLSSSLRWKENRDDKRALIRCASP